MDQLFAPTLSLDDLEEAKALFADLVRPGLLVCQNESTTLEAFSAAASAAALTRAGSNGAPHP